MDEPFVVGGKVLPISACIGSARFPDDTDDIEELYQFADKAMYLIKHRSEKSSCCFYSPETVKPVRFSMDRTQKALDVSDHSPVVFDFE